MARPRSKLDEKAEANEVIERLEKEPPGWQCSVHYAPQDAGEEMRDWLAGVVPDGTTFCPQCDGDLGVRMRHAGRTELAGGADAVALIGGDCPGLLCAVLDDVAAASRDHDLVIVPATDGGYVLLLVKADHSELFHEIAWSTSQVMQQTKAAADRAGLSVSLLPELTDVDDINDLATLGKLFPRASWGL